MFYLNKVKNNHLTQEKNEIENNLRFSVDAGIINRLGIELVGRSETAVSELIKNSYDADSNIVDVLFKNTYNIGGTLIIDDDGEGMNFESLKNGFMRLSSTDKIHNPISKKYKRRKSGKKGIGRFSTQRLGSKLIIITKTIEMSQAIKLEIDWDAYKIDVDLEDIENKVTYVDPIKNCGTLLIIEDLRERWGDTEIRRVYRYISNLLQPDFLSDRTDSLNIATNNKDNSFSVYCKRINKGDKNAIEVGAPEKILFDKAIAIIEGYVDNNKDGYCNVNSSKFEIDGDIIPVSSGQNKNEIEKFTELKNVHFKAYYFIYGRDQYYDFDSNFTQLELKSIQKIANQSSGVKLYRNGFRVFPYGEKGNDWLSIDRSLAKLRADNGVNIPFGNHNLFGFIEIIDDSNEDSMFEETASREGLIEDNVFKELQEFIYKTLHIAMLRIASAEKFIEAKKERDREVRQKTFQNKDERFDLIRKSISELQEKIKKDDPDKDEHIASFLEKLPVQIDATALDFQEQIKENAMLRVLAGIGLVIGEFVHEIEQFDTIFNSRIKFLKKKIFDALILGKIDELQTAFLAYQSYTAYFRASVSQNVKRDIEPINLKTTVNSFLKQIENNSNKANIDIKKEFLNQYLFTCPMHPSEWLSILFNFYTNSKKAIKRGPQKKGKILIKIKHIKNVIQFEFFDNGDGISSKIKDKIFTPFFTTSNPVNPESQDVKDNSGTGLGLYIVKKIVNSYRGSIDVVTPLDTNYTTCFKIILPADE